MASERPCPSCGELIRLDSPTHESEVFCPGCGKRFLLRSRAKSPAATPSKPSAASAGYGMEAEPVYQAVVVDDVPPAEAPIGGIETRCTCGNRMDVACENSGETIRCSRCGKGVYVPDKALIDHLYDTHPSQTSFASHPGAVHFEYIRYLLYQRIMLYIAVATIFLGALAGYFIGFWAIIPVVLVLGFLVYQVRGDSQVMACGDLCATMVISLRPTMLAIFTDMGMVGNSYPMIQVFKTTLRDVYGQPLKLGMRLASVASYSAGFQKTDHWVYAYPIPIPCAVSDPLEMEQAMLRIEPWEWQALETKLRTLPRPFKSGQYSVPDGATDAIRME
jgi:hypothetical protein